MKGLISKMTLRKTRILYSLCFFFFCLIDQRIMTASGLDGVKEFFTNLTGVLMALLILFQYRKEDILKMKKPYVIWSAVGAVLSVAAIVWGCYHNPFPVAWAVLVLGCFLFGYIVLYCIFIVVKEKRYPSLNKPMLLIWVIMMVLMVVSRSDYVWPFFYLVMFGCYLLTPFSEEVRQDLYHGLLNGVILSLFVYHAYCCVFRPYDVVRYVGIYANPNNAALYYLQVLVAVMLKYLHAVKHNAHRFFKVFYWLGMGVVLSFVFMTIGRTAWLIACLMCFVFLLTLNRVAQKKRFVLRGLALVLSAVVMFPCTFGIVRYTPPLFHHPVWFWGEWNEAKVHSWDPWNSEKHIDMDELLDNALGRILDTAGEVLQKSPLALTVQAEGVEWNEEERKTPVMTPEEAQDGIRLRKTIYTQYFKDLTLWGRKESEQGFQMHEGYWIGHAHNIYLQYGVDFGIFVLALFLAMSVGSGIILVRRFRKTHELESLGRFLFMLIPLTFGFLEYCWGVSAFATLMLFMGWCGAIQGETGSTDADMS